MAIVAWPPTLPNPSANGYSIQPGDGRLITEMMQGPRRKRKRFVNIPNLHTLTFNLTTAQVGIFENFYEVDLDQGMNDIDMPLVVGGSVQVTTVQVLSRDVQAVNSKRYALTMRVETV